MGEYVDQPLGEYVDQPLSGFGTMYAAAGMGSQDAVDGLMDVMEAAAGVGGPTMEAAAGMGTMYAAAGLGADVGVPTMTPARGAFASSGGGINGQQPPFVSIQTPIDQAHMVTKTLPFVEPIPTSMVTAEGRGSSGKGSGIFASHLFGPMMGVG